MSRLYKKYQKYGGAETDLNFCNLVKEKYIEWGYPEPKFIQFIRKSLLSGYRVWLYDSQTTVSKYVKVKYKNKRFKVRFSNHKPNLQKELDGDCDFFVGRNNNSISTTKDAWIAMEKYFANSNQ